MVNEDRWVYEQKVAIQNLIRTIAIHSLCILQIKPNSAWKPSDLTVIPLPQCLISVSHADLESSGFFKKDRERHLLVNTWCIKCAGLDLGEEQGVACQRERAPVRYTTITTEESALSPTSFSECQPGQAQGSWGSGTEGVPPFLLSFLTSVHPSCLPTFLPPGLLSSPRRVSIVAWHLARQVVNGGWMTEALGCPCCWHCSLQQWCCCSCSVSVKWRSLLHLLLTACATATGSLQILILLAVGKWRGCQAGRLPFSFCPGGCCCSICSRGISPQGGSLWSY